MSDRVPFPLNSISDRAKIQGRFEIFHQDLSIRFDRSLFAPLSLYSVRARAHTTIAHKAYFLPGAPPGDVKYELEYSYTSDPLSLMRNRFPSPIPQTHSSRSFRPHRQFLMVGLLLLSAGCSAPPPSSVELSVRAEPTSELGQYTVSGTATLPEGSRLAVMAIRPLTNVYRSTDPEPEETYAILARNFARVEAGRWQTQLDLWQVGSDGRLREVWQLQEGVSQGIVEPAPNITFMALFEPSHQSEELREQLQLQGPPASDALVQLPTQGQWYLRSTQTLEVPLPIARQTPPTPSEADLNGGWGDRSILKPQPTNPGILDTPSTPLRTTNAPLSTAEFMH